MVHQGAAAGQHPATWAPATAWPPPLQDRDAAAASTPRKRKAESQDNERLSKRLSLLNLEQNGAKLYLPVESPGPPSRKAACQPWQTPPGRGGDVDGSMMQLDDSKHKVYVYNIDDELDSASDADAHDGRLIFLPDVEQHLRGKRIPRHVLASPDGELAGMQMVLYSDPRSLTVPEEHDGVCKAILDARHRLRERQRCEREGIAWPRATAVPAVGQSPATPAADGIGEDPDAMDMD